MTFENFAFLSSRGRFSLAAIILALIAAAVWAVAYFLQTAPPRHIVLASGLEDGLLHQYAKRYIEILARSGVTVEERITNGPGDNLRLLQDPHSGVDIGFTRGGIAKFPEANNVMMLASLYYVPMWIFYRNTDTLSQVKELRNRRVAVGVGGSGARSLGDAVLALNGLTSDNITMQPLSNSAALLALRSGEVDAAIFVDGAENHAVWTALHDPTLKLLSYRRTEAYHRRLNFITKLTLPPGVIDLANNIPESEVELIGTKEMGTRERIGGPARAYRTTSSFTLVTPRSTMPIVSAAEYDKSTFRPATNGPRSLMRTVTDRPVATSVTRTRVPNGNVR